MKRDLNSALDECLARLQAGGATLEECIAGYPEYADRLCPLLEVALEIRRIPRPCSSLAAFAAGKRRMLDALAEKQRHPSISAHPFPRRLSLPITLAAGLALILLTIGYFWLLPGSKTMAHTATLDPVNGGVEVMPAGTQAWRPAFDGERVQAGDRVRTGPLSAARLVFFDGSTTELQAEAQVTIVQISSRADGARMIALSQTLGQTYNRVSREHDRPCHFEIETPTAVATVRGTEFTVAVETSGATHVAVIQGLVEVTAQRTIVAVQAGQVTTVRPRRPPSSPAPASDATPTSTPTPTAATPAITATLSAPSSPIASTPIHRPLSPEETETPFAASPIRTPQPPGHTRTPQPPGQTKTPQPPGQTKTPQPPGQDKSPPGQTKPPKPPKKP